MNTAAAESAVWGLGSQQPASATAMAVHWWLLHEAHMAAFPHVCCLMS